MIRHCLFGQDVSRLQEPSWTYNEDLKDAVLSQHFIQDMRFYLSPLSNWEGTRQKQETRFLPDSQVEWHESMNDSGYMTWQRAMPFYLSPLSPHDRMDVSLLLQSNAEFSFFLLFSVFSPLISFMSRIAALYNNCCQSFFAIKNIYIICQFICNM